jgi:hypothetical protein
VPLCVFVFVAAVILLIFVHIHTLLFPPTSRAVR